jgi:Arc/MetJ family transcription regulator
MHTFDILQDMRTTLNLDEDLIREAREFSGIDEKTALVHAGLRELIAKHAARRLAALAGTMPAVTVPQRRRSQRAK